MMKNYQIMPKSCKTSFKMGGKNLVKEICLLPVASRQCLALVLYSLTKPLSLFVLSKDYHNIAGSTKFISKNNGGKKSKTKS